MTLDQPAQASAIQRTPKRLALHRLFSLWLCLSIFSAFSHAQESLVPLPTAQTPFVYASPMHRLSDGRLIVANALSHTVALIEPQRTRLQAEIAVGQQPTHISITPDGAWALVVNQGDNSLSWLNIAEQRETLRLPFSPELSIRGALALAPDEALLLLGETAYRWQAGRLTPTRLGQADSGSRWLLGAWGQVLFGADDLHTWLWRNDYVGAQWAFPRTGTQLLALDARRGRAFVASQATARASELATYASIDELQLNQLRLTRSWFLPVADRLMPPLSALTYDPRLERLYLAYGSADRVVALDLATGLRVGEFQAGAYPTALVLARDNLSLYVYNSAEQSITVAETQYFSPLDSFPTSAQDPSGQSLLGARLFHASPKPASTEPLLQYPFACVTCHTLSPATSSSSPASTQRDSAWLSQHLKDYAPALSTLEQQALLAYVQAYWHRQPAD